MGKVLEAPECPPKCQHSALQWWKNFFRARRLPLPPSSPTSQCESEADIVSRLHSSHQTSSLLSDMLLESGIQSILLVDITTSTSSGSRQRLQCFVSRRRVRSAPCKSRRENHCYQANASPQRVSCSTFHRILLLLLLALFPVPGLTCSTGLFP